MEILLKEIDEQISVRLGHTAHGSCFDLEVMARVDGEVVVGEDVMRVLDKKLSGG